MATGLEKVLETHARIVEEGYLKEGSLKYNTYAISNLRGGVGKSSLAFNLSYEISRKEALLIADVCPQCNLTDIFLHDISPKITIFKALQPLLLGPAFGDEAEDISYRVSEFCSSFKGGKRCYFVPGDPEMFSFPSELYQQLQLAHSRSGGRKDVVKKLLLSLKGILDKEAADKQCDKILMDTSPFYAGGTHLAWCAAEALIIPVKVDEHSIESLELTLDMLTNRERDFIYWNQRAGELNVPRVAAIVMTMVGSKSQQKSTPDAASRMYIERAISKAEKYYKLFDYGDPSEAFVITDDFVSSGRISGAKSIPIAELKVRSFHSVEGRRLQVNISANRYKNELKYLASIL